MTCKPQTPHWRRRPDSHSSLSVLLIATCLAALAGMGCQKAEKVNAATTAPPQVHGEQVILDANSPQLASLSIESVQQSASAKMRFNGRLAWDDNVTVRIFTPFGGRVTRMEVEAGQSVQKDAVLAAILSPDYGQAQAEARKASSDFALAERTVNRVHELYEHGAAPLKDWQSAEAEFSRAQAEKMRAEAKLAVYGGTTKVIDQIYELKTPVAGVVVEKNLYPGQELRADQMLANAPQLCAPLFVITDPARLWVHIDVAESDLIQLKPGQEFVLHARSYPGEEFRGKIDVVSDFLDPMTRTARVRGSLVNARRALKAEMLVDVDLAAEASPAIQVPTKAVFLKGDKHYIFVEENHGRFTRREVKLGTEVEGRTILLDGLPAGARVVTDGGLLLEQLVQTEGT